MEYHSLIQTVQIMVGRHLCLISILKSTTILANKDASNTKILLREYLDCDSVMQHVWRWMMSKQSIFFLEAVR